VDAYTECLVSVTARAVTVAVPNPRRERYNAGGDEDSKSFPMYAVRLSCRSLPAYCCQRAEAFPMRKRTADDTLQKSNLEFMKVCATHQVAIDRV